MAFETYIKLCGDNFVGRLHLVVNWPQVERCEAVISRDFPRRKSESWFPKLCVRTYLAESMMLMLHPESIVNLIC